MSNLYVLTKDIEQLYTDLINSVDEDTGEVNLDISNALAVKEEEFNEKAVAVATVSRRLTAKTDEIDAEINRLKALKNRYKAASDSLKNSLSIACQKLGKTKIEGISAQISFIASERVIPDDENLIPEEYFTVVVKKTPDLIKIKKAIKERKTVNGVHLEKYQNIQIK